MAVVAGIAAADMGRVLAFGDNTVVTGIAGANDLRVIDNVSGCEKVGVVAVLAHVRGLNVGNTLADSIGAVVAATAIADDSGVVEKSGQPGGGRMAVVTICATGYVFWMFAGCRNIVMARATGREYLGMVNGICWSPDVRVMAVFAYVAGWHVCSRLAHSFYAVVATDTVS